MKFSMRRTVLYAVGCVVYLALGVLIDFAVAKWTGFKPVSMVHNTFAGRAVQIPLFLGFFLFGYWVFISGRVKP